MSAVRYCTAVTASQLPQALRLARRLTAAQPTATLHILLSETPRQVARLRSQLAQPLLAPDELGCPDWLGLAFGYGEADYPKLLRPWLLARLLERGPVAYLAPGSDGVPSDAALLAAVGDGSLVLGRPLTAPPPLLPSAAEVGPFALHCLALGPGAATGRLLAAWQQRLADRRPVAASTDTIPDAELGLGLASLADRLTLLPSQPLPAEAAQPALRSQPYSFASYLNGVAIPADHRRAFRLLADVNRRAIVNPFADSFLLEQLAGQATELGCPHCFELESRLQQLPYSLLTQAGQVLELLRPASLAQLSSLADDLRRIESSGRSYAGQALDRLLPGGRERMYALGRDAAHSTNPALRLIGRRLAGPL